MAKNREPEKPVESETESEEEEDDEATSEDAGSQDSDSEPEQTQVSKMPSSSTQATPKKAQPQSSSKPQTQPPSSSDEEESGSESDSDSEEPDPNVRPKASKPMENEQNSNNGARKLRSKPIASDLATPAKKSKKKAEADTCEKKCSDDSKKLLFQRVWSEDDEIVILKGMIDYVSKKKSDPVGELNAFHDFIKKNLHVEVSRSQLQDKIRRLRRKYENNKSKEKEGKDRSFGKPHEQKAFELSKKIWGNEEDREKRVLAGKRVNLWWCEGGGEDFEDWGRVFLKVEKGRRVEEAESGEDGSTSEAVGGEDCTDKACSGCHQVHACSLKLSHRLLHVN
ncbi:UNVERIFIED_CONTAM: putative transcription factor [Sesamum latifolium]|uniref:Transcription factor n=1 Tax=Sesamum latifolium TaxID=2727402 RepID=A0AAW2UYI1_9LAMI